ncbi:MAG: DUF814 domain-containing protein [Candidatus Kapabacteria bacterium]|nr:DUF814 domain-containing protein [Candidatus Kapabacteria bacterium]
MTVPISDTVRHPHTLHHLAREFSRALSGMIVTECYSQESGTVVVAFEEAGKGIPSRVFVECTVQRTPTAIMMRPDAHRAKVNVRDVLPLLIGDVFREARAAENDRILTLVFDNSSLHCVLFTGQHANVIHCNAAGYVVDVLLRPRKGVAARYNIGEEFHAATPVAIRRLADMPTVAVRTALARSEWQCTLHQAMCIAQSLNIDSTVTVESLPETSVSALEECAVQVFTESRSQRTFIHRTDASGMVHIGFASIEENTQARGEYLTCNDAVRWLVIEYRKRAKYENLHTALYQHLSKTRQKLLHALDQMQHDEESRSKATVYKHWAELLLAQPDVHLQPGFEVTVHDWDGMERIIPLDAKLNLAQNAQHYFSKVRSMNDAARIRAERIPLYHQRLANAEQSLTLLAEHPPLTTLTQMQKELLPKHESKDSQKSAEGKFREFDLGEGYTLFVGKNAQNNDELTMRFAKPNDYWMHARGVGGSHTVLKGGGGKKPPKNILEKAAQITAYYSQARNAKYTPVIYTPKKNVRKPKGANVGAVVVDREDVIMVEPKLPAGAIE